MENKRPITPKEAEEMVLRERIEHHFMTPKVTPIVRVSPDVIQNHIDQGVPMPPETAKAVWLANHLLQGRPEPPDIAA